MDRLSLNPSSLPGRLKEAGLPVFPGRGKGPEDRESMTPSSKRPRRPLPEAAVVKEDKWFETRLADSPGGMIPEAGQPLEGMSVLNLSRCLTGNSSTGVGMWCRWRRVK
jgi:hypothetical protein